jgi:NAD(P)H-flavin reductase
MASAYTVWRHLPSDKPTPRVYLYVSAGLFVSMSLLQSYSVIRHNKISWYHQIRLHLRKPLKIDDGQYVKLWIPSVSFWSSHPFMVISWEPSKQEFLDLLIEPHRGLTRDLLYYAKKGYNPIAMFSGPHGPCVAMDKYMVASGFGIAAQLPHLKRLLYGYNTRVVQARRIHLVW